MTDCEACTKAEADLTSGLYQSGCLSCEARSLAKSAAAQALERDPGERQAALRNCWPDVEKYRKGRALVWVWIKRITAAKGDA